ncbi:MAG: class I SAM-dependent methyltransferase [Pseudomonadota bacterium]|nr:class I SAM-dependent methyltransferase [Pseudomonadota bacterium]
MLDLSREYLPYYAQRAGEKDRARQVGWRDQSAQRARFQQFVRAIRHEPEAGFAVADVGCGLGDLLPFLRAEGFARMAYTGYDIIPDMIEAATAYHNDPDASFRLIEDVRQIEQTDYCFASGIFNAKNGHAQEAWWDHIRTCIAEMAAKSTCAVAFNMLSAYSDEEKQETSLHYADPCHLFSWCKREITPDVALFHDYGHWDFTIVLRIDHWERQNGAA